MYTHVVNLIYRPRFGMPINPILTVSDPIHTSLFTRTLTRLATAASQCCRPDRRQETEVAAAAAAAVAVSERAAVSR